MKSSSARWIVGISALVSLAAFAAEPLSSVLSVHRMSVDASGHEQSSAADVVKPGDTLEYAVDFRNTGSQAIHGLDATLPLPAGTEFVAGSERPAAALASVDGVNFEPQPLKRRVTRPDGSSVEELVPTREYRFLRWTGNELAAHASTAVSARVIVSKAGSAQ